MNKTILLLFSAGNKLKETTLFHLLKGKRSTSVLLFGYFQQNLKFFGLAPQLTKEIFAEKIRKIKKAGLLTQQDDVLILTAKGQEVLKELQQNYPLSYLNNYQFGRFGDEMWRSIKLAVQVVSHLSYQDKQYVPVESNLLLLNHVKAWLRRHQKKQLVTAIPVELTQIFSEMTQQDADFLAKQLTGFHRLGAVDFQLQAEIDANLNHLIALDCIHQLLTLLKQQKDFLLFDLLLPFFKQSDNQSMLTTKHLYLAGHSIDEIMNMRQLKRGTINDHILEWALQDDVFPFASFISEATKIVLKQVKIPIMEWSYREINEATPLDYLEFRLVQITRFKEEVLACD